MHIACLVRIKAGIFTTRRRITVLRMVRYEVEFGMLCVQLAGQACIYRLKRSWIGREAGRWMRGIAHLLHLQQLDYSPTKVRRGASDDVLTLQMAFQSS
jgi:hypothetical protein